MKLNRIGKNLLNSLVDLIYPPQCLVCDDLITREHHGHLCPSCYPLIHLIKEPLCSCCGSHFPKSTGGNHLCGACLKTPPEFDLARALVLYEEPIKSIIHQFKYRGMTNGLNLFKTLKETVELPEEFNRPEMIIPVPIHLNRLKNRGFNQSVILAEKFYPDRSYSIKRKVLIRARDTIPQTTMSGKERRNNLKGAFVVERPEMVTGKNIVIIDDVFTTGTTADECAKSLKKAGAGKVMVLTLARINDH